MTAHSETPASRQKPRARATRGFRAPLAFLLASSLLLAGARAEPVSATASLSSNVTVVGAPVVLTITVNGARGADAPRSISVDDLDIRYAGESTQIKMRNFQMTALVTHSYRVVPRGTGEFTIPAQNIIVGNDRLRTNPVTLTVRPRSGGSARATSPGQPDAADEPATLDDLARADLIVPKDSAYVGEAVPIELRFYFDGSTDFQARSGPELPSEGFTLEPFPQPRQEETTEKGRRFSLVTFQSVITPVKAGDLELGPAAMDVTAAIRRARPNLQHLADSFFNDPFFNRSFSGFTTNEELTIRSGVQKLTVKPLPTAGQPENFGGSVGQFDITADADAKKVSIGDPVTMKVTISGRGNFDRMDAPEIEPGAGWRSYPPSGTFVKDDTLGVSGAKTFAYQLVPTDRTDKLPAVSFSYFDPAKEKYVTVGTKELPIVVTGTPLAAASPAPPAGATPAPTASPAEPDPTDILGLATDLGATGQSFTPLYRRPEFLYGQALPGLALLGLLALGGYRRWSSDTTARRDAALRTRRARVLSTLQKRGLPRAEFYAEAVRALQLETARRTGAAPETLHEPDVRGSADLDPETDTALGRIFAAHNEAAYSGETSDVATETIERDEAIRAVKRFIDSHA